MDNNEKRQLIDQYIAAYNAFDTDGMMKTIHPDIEFENITSGVVNATARGTEQFKALAEQSKYFFSSRKQTITNFTSEGDQASIEISYEAVLAMELPNGMKKGEIMNLKGRSEFVFKDGKIWRLTDIS